MRWAASVLLAGLFAALQANAADYDATYSSPPIRVCPGKTTIVPLTMTNTGSRSWAAGGQGLYAALGDWVTYHLRNNVTNAIERDVVMRFLPRSVPPGDTITLDVEVVGPAARGSYTLQWDMVRLDTHFSTLGVPTGDVQLDAVRSIGCLADMLSKVHGLITGGPDLVEPNNTYLFPGVDLGERPGTVALVGNFPGGRLQLEVVWWGDVVVGVRVPDICGVVDQDAMLEVTLASGETTEWPVSFRAKREVRTLVQDDMQVSCSQAAERNRCNGEGEGPATASPVDLAKWYWYAATGQHQCGWDSTEGVDTFSVTLINGWRPYGRAVKEPVNPACGDATWCVDLTPPSTEPPYVGPVSRFDGPSSTATLTVPWGCLGQSKSAETWLCGIFVPFPLKLACLDRGIQYIVNLYIEGPCGTPYR
jgi:hypothetical protein